MGSVVVGDASLIESARKWRKMLGGGMRQAGIMAAAGLFALKNHVTDLRKEPLFRGLCRLLERCSSRRTLAARLAHRLATACLNPALFRGDIGVKPALGWHGIADPLCQG